MVLESEIPYLPLEEIEATEKKGFGLSLQNIRYSWAAGPIKPKFYIGPPELG